MLCARLTFGLRVNACDREEKYKVLREEFADIVNILYVAHPSTSAETSIETT